ncbi:MAG: hypothetical protein KatS3mg051_2219 [Anaerolineae bacterium]|nr:MAG: hypothetical protein KatS3mg051_2219 [Anaerolineae bacterium]
MMKDMYRVFRYGVVRILEGEDALLEQLRARARYWNRLVEIEQAYRAECERIMHADPRVADLEQRIQALADDNRQELRALRRDLREAQRAVRQDARVQEQLQQAATQRTAAVRVARHQYGLYWGNYLDVEMMYRAARGRNGHRLRFTPTNTGEGAVSVWFQHGLPTSWVWGRDSRLMMDPLPAGVWETHRTHHDPRLRTTVRLRVGSTTERQPIYVVAMVVMHRPLPEEGLIRHASIVRRRIGGRVRYQLCITVAVPPPAPRTSGDVIGVDVGWRRLADGMPAPGGLCRWRRLRA